MTSPKRLNQIRYEIKHQERLSNDIFRDSLHTKYIMESLINNDLSTINEMHGYMQNLSLDPYGFLLISEIQVKKLF